MLEEIMQTTVLAAVINNAQILTISWLGIDTNKTTEGSVQNQLPIEQFSLLKGLCDYAL